MSRPFYFKQIVKAELKKGDYVSIKDDVFISLMPAGIPMNTRHFHSLEQWRVADILINTYNKEGIIVTYRRYYVEDPKTGLTHEATLELLEKCQRKMCAAKYIDGTPCLLEYDADHSEGHVNGGHTFLSEDQMTPIRAIRSILCLHEDAGLDEVEESLERLREQFKGPLEWERLLGAA